MLCCFIHCSFCSFQTFLMRFNLPFKPTVPCQIFFSPPFSCHLLKPNIFDWTKPLTILKHWPMILEISCRYKEARFSTQALAVSAGHHYFKSSGRVFGCCQYAAWVWDQLWTNLLHITNYLLFQVSQHSNENEWEGFMSLKSQQGHCSCNLPSTL